MGRQQGWKIKQVDFDNAFVQANLYTYVYIQLPALFYNQEGEDPKNLCLKLEKSLYGKSDAPHIWYLYLKTKLKKFRL